MSRLRGFPPIFGEIASIVVWAFRKSASFRPRKPPALRAVVPARAHKSARAFSCTIFDPSVLVGASSISLASPQAAKLAHFAAPPLHPATDVLGRGVGSAIQPQHGVESQLWARIAPPPVKGAHSGSQAVKRGFPALSGVSPPAAAPRPTPFPPSGGHSTHPSPPGWGGE